MSRTAIARVIYPVHNLLSEGRLSSWYISLDIHSQLEQTLLSSSGLTFFVLFDILRQ